MQVLGKDEEIQNVNQLLLEEETATSNEESNNQVLKSNVWLNERYSMEGEHTQCSYANCPTKAQGEEIEIVAKEEFDNKLEQNFIEDDQPQDVSQTLLDQVVEEFALEVVQGSLLGDKIDHYEPLVVSQKCGHQFDKLQGDGIIVVDDCEGVHSCSFYHYSALP